MDKDKIKKKCLLRDLSLIRVNDKSSFSSKLYFLNFIDIVLLFTNETELLLSISNNTDREKLLSALLTLRSLNVPQINYIDRLCLLINSSIDFSHKIYGHDPTENQAYVQEYENLLLKKLSENINYKDNMKI